KGLRLVARCQGPIPATIRTDPTRLRQVLLNVVGNAIKFTSAGTVTIDVEMLAPLEAQSPRLAFTISDTGIGMTEEQLARLFQRFEQSEASTTRRYGGTGLGLAISKHLTQLLGGDLTASCLPGGGCQFTTTVACGPLEELVLVEGGLEGPVRRAAPSRGST